MPYFVRRKINKKYQLYNNVRRFMRKASITFRCKEELKRDLEEIAELNTKDGEKVNISNTINVILTEYVKDNKE